VSFNADEILEVFSSEGFGHHPVVIDTLWSNPPARTGSELTSDASEENDLAGLQRAKPLS